MNGFEKASTVEWPLAAYKCPVCGQLFITGKDLTLLMEHHDLVHPDHAALRFVLV